MELLHILVICLVFNKEWTMQQRDTESQLPVLATTTGTPRVSVRTESYAAMDKVVPKNNATRYYITPRFMDRLGNQMFQLASAYGVARTVGKVVHIVNSSSATALLSIFPRIGQRVFVTTQANHSEIIHEKSINDPKPSAYVPKVIREARALRNLTMKGYFQSYKYFDQDEDVRNEIRDLFAFRDDLIVEADRQLMEIRELYLSTRAWATMPANKKNATSELPFRRTKAPDNFVYVTLHVRRGDMRSGVARKFGFRVATEEYIHKALLYFSIKYRSRTTALIVLVVGEASSLAWCREHIIATSTDDYVVDYFYFVGGGNSREQDMALMTRCNATVLTVGTFGWWTAYLTGGEVIYYAFPFKKKTPYASQFSAHLEDFFPPSWKALA